MLYNYNSFKEMKESPDISNRGKFVRIMENVVQPWVDICFQLVLISKLAFSVLLQTMTFSNTHD